MKTPPTVLRYLSVYFCLLFSYALLLSTVTPIGPRTVNAYRAQLHVADKSEVSFPTSNQAQRREGELLVRFRAGVAQQNKETVLASHGTRTKGQLRGESGVEKLEVLAGQDPETVARLLRLQPEVEFAEPNFLVGKDDITTSDPRFDEQWALRNTGQNGGQFGSDINVTAAWQTTTGSQAGLRSTYSI